ncbi:MAG: OmpH family outer membrane protein [Planctomycetes bacterium]|nr:OmpH family outer membrane protein [Planctomycetota bacterium]
MHKIERLVLALSALAIAWMLLGRPSPDAPASARSPFMADLGPAQNILLEGKDGVLTLRNEASHLAWGEQPTSRVWSSAAVHVDKVLKTMLKTDRFVEERNQFDDAAKKQSDDFQRQMEAIKSKYGEMAKDNPELAKGKEEMQSLFQQYQKWNEGVTASQSKLMAGQVETAYRELVTAVDVVCDRQKIDMVYRFIPAAAPFESAQLGDAMVQVQARTFLRCPESLDITADVMKELGLKDP